LKQVLHEITNLTINLPRASWSLVRCAQLWRYLRTLL